ncbi:MAG: fasciclin domain-containing protein [Bacteroidales bacterium]|nr:fasciclin domain-containing protein [Bacteroidales bacterium]
MKKMNNIINYTISKVVLLSVLIASLGFHSCQDDVDNAILTVESVQIATFLENDTALYSEFTNLIKAAGMYDLLNAYGVYTCFVPSNEAVRNYYQKEGVTFETLTDSMIVDIVQNHIISGRIGADPIETINFPIGSISTPNMNEIFLRIGTEGGNRFTVNGSAKIIKWDDKVHNGIIHTIDQVLEAPTLVIDEVLAPLEDFSIFYDAMKVTGLIDSLYLTDNPNYQYVGKIIDEKGSGNRSLMETPPFCKYGYTVFMESNSTLANVGINNLQDLITKAEEIYYVLFPLDPSDESRIKQDYTDRNNALNRFVSYHMMDRMMDTNEFIKADWDGYFLPNTIIREYIEMMMPNSLIEVQTGNIINKSMYPEDNDPEIKITGNVADVANVMFLEINNFLTYKDVETNVLNKRLRMDASSLFSEFATNKLRGDFTGYIIPQDFLKNLIYTEGTQCQYIGSSGWGDMQGDELLFAKKYDFSLKTPPLPPGRWEFRIAYTANPRRGVAQMFLDGKPCGIPLDMRINATHANIGWIADADTQDNGVENDKMMRNRGYMKGPSTVLLKSSSQPLRQNNQSLRRIVTTEEFQTAGTHILRIKSVEDNTTSEFHLDFVEFVPSSYLEQEGRD